MLKCTGKKTNDSSLVQHKLKYSHQLDTDLDQAHTITVKQVRPLVETKRTVSAYRINLISLKKTKKRDIWRQIRFEFPYKYFR